MTDAPRIALLNTFDERGGAARVALRLHRQLLASGVESRLLVQRRFGDAPGVDGARGGPAGAWAWLRPRLESIPVRLHRGRRRSLFSGSFLPDGLRPRLAAFAPDVVHAHWVGFGFLRPETLAAFPVPVVWTLHDSWPFTGGCHLPEDCVRYRESCGRCPHLASRSDRDLSSRLFDRKRRAWQGRRITVVSPSRWLAAAARSSSLFREQEVVVIPNGVDLKRLRPLPRDDARRGIGLETSRFVLLFSGLEGLGDRNKGYHLLQAALDRLAGQGLASRFLLLVIGIEAPKDPPRSAIPIRFAGRLDDESDLALHLSAADALALPSLQENQPNLVIEAMACGKAAVAFGATGLSELVAHRETGYLATPHESEDLAAGIAWLAEAPDRAVELGRRARSRAERDHGIDRMADRYLELYRSLAPGPSNRPRTSAPRGKGSEADPRASW